MDQFSDMSPSTEDLIELSMNGNFGLAQAKWTLTLVQIRNLPQTYERTYPYIPLEEDPQPEN